MKTEIIIPGLRAASKKNSRRNFGHVSLPSKAYENFHDLVAEYLLPFAHCQFGRPLRMTVDYQIKGNYHQDSSNALASIEDCLQDYGVILDDDIIYDTHIVKSRGNKDWKITIQLEEI